MDINGQCRINVDQEELNVITTALSAFDFDSFQLDVDTSGGSFQPYLTVTGKFREPRDLDWQIEKILDVLDQIDWDVSHLEADSRVAEIVFFISPGGSNHQYKNTRDAVRKIKGGDRL